MNNQAEVREFLTSRRDRITPQQVGLPAGGRRKVPGLRRSEVATLAGVSVEYYTKLERGFIRGASPEVLDSLADALQLNDDERGYLLDLARAARPEHRRHMRRREASLQPHVQWMLDSITLSAAFVRNGRLDVIGSNALGRVLHEPMFKSPTAVKGRANFARYFFLDDSSREFFVDWTSGAAATVALLRAEAGREPQDTELRELVNELSTLSEEFRVYWASHDIRSRHDGSKRLRNPQVGELELTYQSVNLPAGRSAWQELSFYTAEPGSPSEDCMKMLASLSASDSDNVSAESGYE